jgi:hypothetical protein
LIARQTALDRSRMHSHREAFLDSSGQVSGAQGWIVLARLSNELQDRRTQLARLFGPALEWDKTRQTTLRKGGLGLVERRPRETKLGGSFGDRLPVFLDAAHHLVLDLNQVAGIEELAGGKQVVGHGLGAWIYGALLAQTAQFGVVGWRFRHGRLWAEAALCKEHRVTIRPFAKLFLPPNGSFY